MKKSNVLIFSPKEMIKPTVICQALKMTDHRHSHGAGPQTYESDEIRSHLLVYDSNQWDWIHCTLEIMDRLPLTLQRYHHI